MGLVFPYALIYKTWLNSFDLEFCSASLTKFCYFALIYAVTGELPSAHILECEGLSRSKWKWDWWISIPCRHVSLKYLFCYYTVICILSYYMSHASRWKSTCDITPLDLKRGNQGQFLEAFVKRK